MIREANYKGEIDMEKPLLNLPWACASTLGVFLLLGVIGACRGLSTQCQEGALSMIENLLHCIRRKSFKIRLLPAWEIEVNSCQVNMSEVLAKFSPAEQGEIKTRLDLRYCIVDVRFETPMLNRLNPCH